MAPNHVAVHDEAASAKHDPFPCSRVVLLTSGACEDSVNASGLVGDESLRASVVAHLYVELVDATCEHIHEIPSPSHAHKLWTMSARAGLGLAGERPCLFAARPDEAVIGDRLDDLPGDVGCLVLHPLLTEPVEVRQALVSIKAGFRLIRVGTACHRE